MNMLSSVDTKTMIHVGVEIVVIGGVTFWLNKRISGVQDIVGDLVKKIELLESIIQQQEQMISRHENILRQITGGHARPQTSSPQTSSPQTSSPAQPPSQQDQELSPGDLDALLEEQLSIINNDREKKGTLKPRRTKKKGRHKHKSHGD